MNPLTPERGGGEGTEEKEPDSPVTTFRIVVRGNRFNRDNEPVAPALKKLEEELERIRSMIREEETKLNNMRDATWEAIQQYNARAYASNKLVDQINQLHKWNLDKTQEKAELEHEISVLETTKKKRKAGNMNLACIQKRLEFECKALRDERAAMHARMAQKCDPNGPYKSLNDIVDFLPFMPEEHIKTLGTECAYYLNNFINRKLERMFKADPRYIEAKSGFAATRQYRSPSPSPPPKGRR